MVINVIKMVFDNPFSLLELPEISILQSVPQGKYHQEGNVLNHIKLCLHKALQLEVYIQKTLYPELFYLAVVLHDIGKKEVTEIRDDGSVTSYNHDIVSAYIAEQFLDKYLPLLSQGKKDYVIALIKNHMRLNWLLKDKTATHRAFNRLQRQLSQWFDDLILLSYIDNVGRISDDPMVSLSFCTYLDMIERRFGYISSFSKASLPNVFRFAKIF